MNYNTNRTIQAICAKAIILQTNQYFGTCGNIATAAAQDWFGFIASDNLNRDYHFHSGACTDRYGFHQLGLFEWRQLSAEAKQAYRLEMLYYFWLANQDSMDAFS